MFQDVSSTPSWSIIPTWGNAWPFVSVLCPSSDTGGEQPLDLWAPARLSVNVFEKRAFAWTLTWGAHGGSWHVVPSPSTACHIPSLAAMSVSLIQISALRRQHCGRDGSDARAWECVGDRRKRVCFPGCMCTWFIFSILDFLIFHIWLKYYNILICVTKKHKKYVSFVSEALTISLKILRPSEHCIRNAKMQLSWKPSL